MIEFFLISVIILVTLAAASWDYYNYEVAFRAVIITVSGVLLLGFVIEPDWWTLKSGTTYAVVSDGADESLISAAEYDSIYSIQSRKFLDAAPKYDRWLSSLHLLPGYISEGSTVHFYGYGTDEDLPSQFRWVDKSENPEPGIQFIDGPQQVETGQTFNQTVRLIPSDDSDTLTVFRDGRQIFTGNAESDGDFIISDELYSPGPARYRFEWQRSDSLIIENRNIRAVQPERLSIAMLLYSPSFEMNHLMETFSDRGHRFATRIRLGENRFRYDNMNSPPSDAEELLSGDLNRFNLLILDSREFEELAGSEKQNILIALQSGLDILLTPPPSDEFTEWAEIFSELSGSEVNISELSRLSERRWIPDDLQDGQSDLLQIPLLSFNLLTDNDDADYLFEYEPDQPVALKIPVENGSITKHLFYRTYPWLLRGEAALYNRFWANYLGDIITVESSFLEISHAIPRIGSETVITAATVSQDQEMNIYSSISGDTTTLPVTRRQKNPNVDFSTFFPEESGWHSVNYKENRTWFYVYDEDWKFNSDYQKKIKTSNRITALSRESLIEPDPQRRPVPEWIWLIGFLFLQSVLWAERKLF